MFTSISQLIKETIQSQRLENRDFSNHPRLYYRKQAITTTNRKHAHTQTRVVPHRAICAARQQNISFSFPRRRLHINAQVFQSSNTHPISSPILPDLQIQFSIRFKTQNDIEKEIKSDLHHRSRCLHLPEFLGEVTSAIARGNGTVTIQLPSPKQLRRGSVSKLPTTTPTTFLYPKSVPFQVKFNSMSHI